MWSKQARNITTAMVSPQQKQLGEGNQPNPKISANQKSKTRTNWGISEIMREAVEAFSKNEGTLQALSVAYHAMKFQIPRDTFYKYVHKDPKKRRKLGSTVGRNM